MTMPPSHPSDELLAGYQDGELGGSAARMVGDHVASCQPCGILLDELAELRLLLAQLPDVPPSRPLVLIPPLPARVADGPRSASARLARMIFAPALSVGLLLSVIGGLGLTGAPSSAPTSGAYAPAQDRGAANAALPSSQESALSIPVPGAGPGTDGTRALRGPEGSPGASSAPGGPEPAPASRGPAGSGPWSVLLLLGLGVTGSAMALRFIPRGSAAGGR